MPALDQLCSRRTKCDSLQANNRTFIYSSPRGECPLGSTANRQQGVLPLTHLLTSQREYKRKWGHRSVDMAADPYSFALLSNHDPYHPIPITSERNGQHIEPRAYYHTHHLLHHQTVSASSCAIHSHFHDPNFSQATDTTPQDSRSRNSLGNLTCKPRRSLAFLTFRTRQARPALHGMTVQMQLSRHT